MRTRFITSAESREGWPVLGLPEMAFVGRSNVGKSSLLNALCNAHIARTSRTPGRTQTINFFEVHGSGGSACLVDLPGYGFARAPMSVRERLGPRIVEYLEIRADLRVVFLLIDARRGVQAEEQLLFESLRTDRAAAPPLIHVVATKCDKIAKAKQKPAAHQIEKALGLFHGHVVPTSTATRQGLDRLTTLLEAVCVPRGSADRPLT